jgi:hypothetical protein
VLQKVTHKSVRKVTQKVVKKLNQKDVQKVAQKVPKKVTQKGAKKVRVTDAKHCSIGAPSGVRYFVRYSNFFDTPFEHHSMGRKI